MKKDYFILFILIFYLFFQLSTLDYGFKIKDIQYFKNISLDSEYIKSFKPKYHDYNRFLIYRKKSDIIWDQNFNDYFQNYQIDEHNELIRIK